MIQLTIVLFLLFVICSVVLLSTIFTNKKLNKTFYTVDETYPWLNELTSVHTFKSILNDLDNVKRIGWQEWPEYNLWKNDTNSKIQWTVFPIKAFGKWSSKNTKLCPNIYNMLKSQGDNIVNVGFSRLSHGTVLRQHQGWANLSNYVLRCHLGLIFAGPAHIYCENDKQQQSVGKWIVFDDAKNHYADNLGNADRIVLIIDVKRPKHVETGLSTIGDSDELLGFIQSFQNEQ